MHSFWQAFTSLGDSGFLLPAGLLIALWLFLDKGSGTAALRWVLMFGTCGLIVMLSKIAFMGWGIGSAKLNFTGFSGHTALATSVWPVLSWMAMPQVAQRRRLIAALLGWCVAISIGISRLALEVHSNSEVIAGAALGTTVSAGFLWWHSRPISPLRGRRWSLVAAVILLAVVSQGDPAPTQGALEVMAAKLANLERPYTRNEMLATFPG